MAILKAINVKKAGRKKFQETLAYVSNQKKARVNGNLEQADRFKKGSWINRCLYGKKDKRRQFKQYVVSMAAVWPKDLPERKKYETALESVLRACEMYFMEQGFWVSAWIHCNTQHPHFHLLLETCNAFNGKQFTQSPLELDVFKEFVSTQLIEHGLGEEILTGVQEITEEELLLEDEPDVEYDFTETDQDNEEETTRYNLDSDYKGNNAWNNGTMEHADERSAELQFFREMVTYAGLGTRQMRELCHIVPEEERKRGRELCNIISEEERKRGRVMCHVVPEAGQNLSCKSHYIERAK